MPTLSQPFARRFRAAALAAAFLVPAGLTAGGPALAQSAPPAATAQPPAQAPEAGLATGESGASGLTGGLSAPDTLQNFSPADGGDCPHHRRTELPSV